jgi:beta-glucosidase
MLLGPTVNIARLPQWGRNFEGYGEDPFLASRMAVAYVTGVQSEGVIATVKHFAVNNQEYERHRVDVKVSERALNEIYFPAFRAAIQEANAGLDVEMPGVESLNKFLENPDIRKAGFIGGFMSPDKLLPAVRNGQVARTVLDDKVRRILWAMMTLGIFDRTETAATNLVDTAEQQAVARDAALESPVLLKNSNHTLPLTAATLKSIAVIGPNADVARTGGGSSRVTPKTDPPTPLLEIKRRAGANINVGYALGCPFEVTGDSKNSPQARTARLNEAVALARKSDVAIVFVGYSPDTEQEHSDRTLSLPVGQDGLIQAVANANRRTIVVLYAFGPVLMSPWLARTAAVLMAWYPGQEAGRAPVAVLFGEANPSGKLPVTFLKDWKDSSAYPNYPGRNLAVDYAEGIYVGYRHFDRKNIEPLFPFGHGLSYTTFAYSDLKITPEKVAPGQPVSVRLNVNTGAVAGAEVVQVHVRDVKSSVDRPVKELKAFRRVMLKPGETQVVTVTLDKGAMSYYDDSKKEWSFEPGEFEVQAGASSQDIRLTASFNVVGN